MISRVVSARLAVLPLACAAACPALALSAGTLSETVVTATRTARTADELMQSVDVLTRQDIETLAPTSLMDLIGSVPGVVVTRAGGPGKAVSVLLRGASSDHVLVLVNGVRAGSATLGDYDWNALPPEQIERVEVVRGPLASLYGSDAIGGVIQIFTRGSREGFEVSQTVGSSGTRESSVRLAGGQATKWVVSASTMGTDGTQMRVTDPDEYPARSANVGLGLSGQLVDGWSYSMGLTHSQGHEKSDVTAGPSDSRNQVIDLGVEGRMSPAWTQRVSVYSASNRVVSPASFPPSDIKTDRKQLSWLHELKLGLGGLTLGLDRLHEGVRNLNTGTGAVVFDRDMTTTGLYGQLSTEWAGNDLQLGLRRDVHSLFGGANTYNLSMGRQLSASTRVYASHGTAFKGPTANDYFWPYSIYNDLTDGAGDCLAYGYACVSIAQGNPHLLPERSQTNEIGLQINGTVKYRVNLFETKVNNLIDWTSTETGSGATSTETWTPSNVGRASMRGLEMGAQFDWARWHVQASFNRVLSRNEQTGAPLDRRPDNTATLAVVRRFGSHALRVGVTAASERYEQSGARRIGGFGRVDLADTVRLGPNWSVRIKVDNLFDKRYTLATSSGVPFATPGRGCFLTLRYTR